MYNIEQAVGMNYDIFVSFISQILLSTYKSYVRVNEESMLRKL
jgi:hypothetical protein